MHHTHKIFLHFSVFKAKVIKRAPPHTSDEDAELQKKRAKLQGSVEQTKAPSKDDEHQREKDALEIQKRHKEFMDTQTRKAEQYTLRKRKLETVSSKAPVVETESPRPGMEGRGPRVVSQSVKNYRKRLKKKAKAKGSVDTE